MHARVYSDKDMTLRPLRGKMLGVIGYGSQGRAQALNLKDRGLNVIIGLQPKSGSRAGARKDGFVVYPAAEVTRSADVLFLALPDMAIARVFEHEIAPHLRKGQTLLFAHGFAIFYRTIVPPPDVDIVMVAPKGLGPMVRREFVAGRGAPALIAVAQNASGRAQKTALAWAKAIGSARAGVIETTFREETETDLFGEQAVLCGGMTELVRAGFETLVEAGYPAELAYFECLHELKFIVDLMHEAGISGMRALISETAKWGDLTVGPKIIDARVKKAMADQLRRIQSGAFAKGWRRESETGRRRFHKLLAAGAAHPIERTGERLRALTSWSAPAPKRRAR